MAEEKVDVPRIRAMVDRVFTPETLNNLTGKPILWVDDNPTNNELAVRALRKFGLDIEQATSTEAAMAAVQRRKFDLVISDMARGDDMRAGYGLLKLLRDGGSKVPFFIFAGSDTPEYRREATERGAQLSTNDMLELGRPRREVPPGSALDLLQIQPSSNLLRASGRRFWWCSPVDRVGMAVSVAGPG
jgi:CheY-like chemotaxis protein